jgi:uncharacterized protein
MTITIHRHSDATAFLERAEEWLLRDEAEHNLLLGIAYALRDGGSNYDPPLYLATVEVDERVAGCAFRTPPFKLGLTRMPDAAVPWLAEDVAEVYASLPAVMGPEREARAFASLWRERTGAAVREGMRQRIFQLDRLVPPERMPPGRFRHAEHGEEELVAGWIAAFAAEAGVPARDPGRLARGAIAAGTLAVWDDGEPRSMAAVAGRTPHGARIGYVYTPPRWRGRGYASAVTAALSQEILYAGRRFCFLFTDLSNPTSNSIYQRIGYRPVCDVVDLEFDHRA